MANDAITPAQNTGELNVVEESNDTMNEKSIEQSF